MPGADDASPQPRPAPVHADVSGVRGYDDERELLRAVSERTMVPAADLAVMVLQLADLDVVPLEVARKHLVLPVLVRDNVVFLAMAAPQDRAAIEEVEFVSGRQVVPFAADPARLAVTIDQGYAARARGELRMVGERASTTASNAPPRAQTIPPRSNAPPPVPPQGPRTSAPSTRMSSRNPTLVAVSAPPPPPVQAVPPRPAQPPPRPVASTGRSVVSLEGERGEELTVALRELGHDVRACRDTSLLLMESQRQRPDLVVLDLDHAPAAALALCRALREQQASAQVPIVLVTDTALPWRLHDDLRDAIGEVHVLVRPIVSARDVPRVQAWLDRAPEPPGDRDVLPPVAEQSLVSSTEAYQRGDLPAAIASIEQGLDAAPESYRLHYHLGLLLGRQGEVFRAVRELERSVALYGAFFPALKNLAVLYEKVAFRRCAVEAWERALFVAPDDATRQQIQEHLLSLLQVHVT